MKKKKSIWIYKIHLTATVSQLHIVLSPFFFQLFVYFSQYFHFQLLSPRGHNRQFIFSQCRKTQLTTKPFVNLNNRCMPLVTLTADNIFQWPEELSFSTCTLHLPKTHSPLYIHKQHHIQIKYIKHRRIYHEIKSSLFTNVCTICDSLLTDRLSQQRYYVKNVILLSSLHRCGCSSV